MPITKPDAIQFDLYHGTSSLHLPSIQAHGLGGCNPVTELNAVSFFRELYTLAGDTIPPDKWCFDKLIYEPIANQVVTDAGLNFRHGGTYLTPSKFTAARYAVDTPQGSECISVAKNLYHCVVQFAPEGVSEIENRYPEIRKRLQQTGTPIIIRLPRLPLKMLKSETGKTAEDLVRKIEEIMSTNDSPEMIDALRQQSNFELSGAVPYTSLSCYKVSEQENGKYEFAKIDITTI